MAFERKADGRGGVVCALILLLAAVALLVTVVAAAGVEELHGTQHMCELKCQHHQNPENRQRCINYCIKYQLAVGTAPAAVAAAAGVEEDEEERRLRGTQHMCEIKCQHHQNPENRQRCINFCIKYQLELEAAAAGAISQVV